MRNRAAERFTVHGVYRRSEIEAGVCPVSIQDRNDTHGSVYKKFLTVRIQRKPSATNVRNLGGKQTMAAVFKV